VRTTRRRRATAAWTAGSRFLHQGLELEDLVLAIGAHDRYDVQVFLRLRPKRWPDETRKCQSLVM
jgi:hypothetical protein